MQSADAGNTRAVIKVESCKAKLRFPQRKCLEFLLHFNVKSRTDEGEKLRPNSYLRLQVVCIKAVAYKDITG